MCTTLIKHLCSSFIIFLSSYLLGTNVSLASYPKDVVSDMALIYQGGTHRPDWTEDQLQPYVTHKFVDGSVDWLFDSYLFFEFTDNWQIAFGYKYGARNARKTDWEWLLGRIFEKGKSLDALNSCIEKSKKIIGEPKVKHKIILGIVSPITDQTDWGILNGEQLDFSNQSDQIKAAKWYIDQLSRMFIEGNYNNLELVGFYWLEESTAKCADLPKYVSDYIHQLDKRFYWIPYWCAPGFDKWKELGFDTAFLQPNHFFNTSVIDARLRDACKLASKSGMALEMEFDSTVLFENEKSNYSRLETYINAFETHGVFDQSPIAYYSGTKGILDMYNSTFIENNIILDKIARHIVERRNQTDGIGNNIMNKEKPNVIGGTGELRILDEWNSIQIYSANGALISKNAQQIFCPAGLYIVVVDGLPTKVIVK